MFTCSRTGAFRDRPLIGLSLCSTHLVFLRGIGCIRFVVIQLNKFRVMGQIVAKVAIMVSGNTEDIARTEL